jgi:hypothetical protein
MTRLTRRPPRVQPPLRGRAAASAKPDQSRPNPMPVLRQHPPRSRPGRAPGLYPEPVVDRTDHGEIPPGLIRLYRLWPYLFKQLDRPWKWLLALVALIILSMIIGSLL